jgi:hypothetical protein
VALSHRFEVASNLAILKEMYLLYSYCDIKRN